MANQQLAQVMTRYSVPVQQQMRRSQYLTDALEALSAPQENIRSPWELAARLAGVAIANRGAEKARDKTATLIRGEKEARLARMLAGLPGAEAPAAPPMPAMPQPPPQQAPQPPPVAQAPMTPTPTQAPAQPALDEQLIAITAQSESRDRDFNPDGSVVTSPAGARGRMQVLDSTNRDPGFGVRPAQGDGLDERARVGRDYLMAMRERYGGDMAKAWGAYNWGPGNLDEALKAYGEDWLSRAPAETQAYVAKNLRALGQPTQMAQAPEPAMAADAPVAPYEVAALGPTPPPPSAPGSSPPVTGAPPVATPQAAAGGSPTTYQPTMQEVSFVRRMLGSTDPEEQARGEAAYWKLMEKMTQAVEWETTNINGVPAQVNKTTGEVRMLGIPEGARTQTVAPPPGMTPGTVVQQKPTGEMSVLQAPPAGYQGGPQQQSFVKGGPQDPAAGQNLLAGEGRLRDDYEKLIKDYIGARDGYQKVVQAAKTGTPAGDIALVFGYMKTLDPGSTVREGEAATIQNSGTIPQTVQNMYNKMLTGEGRLLPEQRQQFASSAEQQFQVYQRTADALNERYGELARSYNFEPSRVIRQFDPIEPYKAPGSGQPPAAVQYPAAVNQAHRNMVARGLYDPKAPLGSERRPMLAADEAAVKAADTPANKGKFIILPSGDVGRID